MEEPTPSTRTPRPWPAWTRTGDLALIAGLLLVGGTVIQIVVSGAFSLVQPACLAVGSAWIAASRPVALSRHRLGFLLFAVGSIAAAVGVGLLPHPIKNGLTAMAVASVALVVSGLALVGVGAAWALRARRRLGAWAGGVGLLALFVTTVSIVAPAVAATNVPPRTSPRPRTTSGWPTSRSR